MLKDYKSLKNDSVKKMLTKWFSEKNMVEKKLCRKYLSQIVNIGSLILWEASEMNSKDITTIDDIMFEWNEHLVISLTDIEDFVVNEMHYTNVTSLMVTVRYSNFSKYLIEYYNGDVCISCQYMDNISIYVPDDKKSLTLITCKQEPQVQEPQAQEPQAQEPQVQEPQAQEPQAQVQEIILQSDTRYSKCYKIDELEEIVIKSSFYTKLQTCMIVNNSYSDYSELQIRNKVHTTIIVKTAIGLMIVVYDKKCKTLGKFHYPKTYFECNKNTYVLKSVSVVYVDQQITIMPVYGSCEIYE